MSCGNDKAQRALSAWVDGDLSLAQRKQIDEHLAGCDSCRAVVRDLRALRQLASELPDHEPPADLLARSFEALDRQRRFPFGNWPRLASLAAVGAVCALALAVLISRTVTWPPMGASTMPTAHTGLPGSDAQGAGARHFDPPLTSAATSAGQSRRARKGPTDKQLLALARAEFDRAEQHYKNAIVALRRIATRESKSWDPAQRTAYRRRLVLIDRLVARVRQAALLSPDDAKVKELLFVAYREQIRFLRGSILRTTPAPVPAPSIRPASFDDSRAALKGTL